MLTQTILLTGGAGYIGSHTYVELLEAGYNPIIIDNLANSSKDALERIEQITNQPVKFYEGDLRDTALLHTIFNENQIEAVIHFAGLKAVGESVAKPLTYYQNNLDSTLALCEVMADHGVKRLIFSSSATVYGTPSELPLKETSWVGDGITNPYGRTKYMIEEILRDLTVSDPSWQVSVLRYFNPIGAHPSGLIGENPKDIPNNLMPYIARVATRQLPELQVFGDDYDTPDGTGVRDYIHVVDLAKGHLAALTNLKNPYEVYNLGTGKGVSVLELVRSFEKASGVTIPFKVVERRPGDIATCYADPSKANRELSWEATKSLEDACADTWRWQQNVKEVA